VKLLNLNIQIW